jgi:hypothetical protein
MADPVSLQQLMQAYAPAKTGKYISQEFQDFAYRIATALQNPPDSKTIGMCMRLVKKKPRPLLEQALSYIADAKARNPVALFLWKVKQLEQQNPTPADSA